MKTRLLKKLRKRAQNNIKLMEEIVYSQVDRRYDHFFRVIERQRIGTRTFQYTKSHTRYIQQAEFDLQRHRRMWMTSQIILLRRQKETSRILDI